MMEFFNNIIKTAVKLDVSVINMWFYLFVNQLLAAILCSFIYSNVNILGACYLDESFSRVQLRFLC